MTAREFPEAFLFFDLLPAAANVDVNTVALLYSCAVPTVWRRSARGKIPAPRKFGASARWNVGELRAALACASATAPQAG